MRRIRSAVTELNPLVPWLSIAKVYRNSTSCCSNCKKRADPNRVAPEYMLTLYRYDIVLPPYFTIETRVPGRFCCSKCCLSFNLTRIRQQASRAMRMQKEALEALDIESRAKLPKKKPIGFQNPTARFQNPLETPKEK